MAMCSFAGCGKDASRQRGGRRGLCQMHYTRERRHGDASITKHPGRGSPLTRFMLKVRFRPDGCWEWTGATNPKGYGVFNADGGSNDVQFAHRWAFEHFRGPIADELSTDHLCHNLSDCQAGNECRHRRCVNPWHMEAVPLSVNQERARERGGGSDS